MAVELSQNRWVVRPDQFAVRIILASGSGLFSRSVIIEPGTKALVVEDGYYVGEVPPGEWTLESFANKLQFWRRKQATIILTRMEHQPLDIRCEGLPTQENLTVDARVRLVVQMADVDAFLHNLLGPRSEFSVEQLRQAIAPLVRQALWTSVGKMTMQELTGPDAALELTGAIYESVQTSLTRYGLAFVEVQSVQIEHKKYEALREKQGQIWLAQARTDQISAELDEFQRRGQVRQQIREALQQADMAKINTKEEMRKFLEDLNKDRLIRKEELDQLVAGYEQRKQDRAAARKHLVSLLEINRQQEVDQARIAANCAVKKATLEHEMELARVAASKDNEAWQRKLEKEREAADYHREHQLREVAAQWERARESNRQQRDDEWEGWVHQQRLERLRADVDVAKAEREGRVELIRLETDKRKTEWELEVSKRKSDSQLDRLRAVQQINREGDDAAHKREIERMQTIGKLGPEAWIATAAAPNAQALADLKKAEFMNSSAQAQLAATKELNEERARMYEKLNKAEQSKADAIAEAFKSSMQSQQGVVTQMIASLGLAASGPKPAAPGVAQAPVVVAPPAAPGGNPVVGGGSHAPAQSVVQAPPTHAPTSVVVVTSPQAAPHVPPMPVPATWYVAVNGQQSGPHPDSHVKQLVAAGQVQADTLVWKPGLPQWSPAGQFPEFFAGPPPMPK